MKPLYLIEVPQETQKVYSTLDDAVDKEATGPDRLQRYKESLSVGHLSLKDGAIPVSFFIKPLTKAQYDKARIEAIGQADDGDGDMSDQAFAQAMLQAAFRLGCKSIEDVPVIEENGERKRKKLERRWFGHIPTEMRIEIGGYILALSEPPEPPELKDDVGK